MSLPHYDAGRYRLRIVSAALGESKPKEDGSATPQVEIGVEVIGRYEGSELYESHGPGRTVFLPLTDECLGDAAKPGWVAQTLKDLGFTGGSFADLGALVGQERDGQCKHDDYTGEVREKWSIYRQSREPQRPADPKTVRQLDAKHKALLQNFLKQPAGTPPTKLAAPHPRQFQPPQHFSTREPADQGDTYQQGSLPGSKEEQIPF